MRLAFSSLILAAGLATAAYAQEPAAQPPAPAPQSAPPAAAQPAPAQPAPPEAAAQPAPAQPAPAQPEAQPAAPPAEPAAPPPTLPTSGYGFEALQVLEKVCIPIVRGQPLETVAKANGFRLNRREQTWTKPFSGGDRNHQIIVFPLGSNKTVCNVELRYPMGTDAEIAKALNVWAFVQQPPLDPTANYTQPQDPDGLKRVRRSWEHLSQGQSIGLNFSTVRKPDDTAVNSRYDMGTLQYQERKL